MAYSIHSFKHIHRVYLRGACAFLRGRKLVQRCQRLDVLSVHGACCRFVLILVNFLCIRVFYVLDVADFCLIDNVFQAA